MTILKRTIALLAALASMGVLCAGDLDGRWLFQISLQQGGRKLPVLILEVEGQQARILSANSQAEFSVESFDAKEDGLELTIKGPTGALTFDAALQGDDLLRGTVNGAGLRNRDVVAQRTELARLGRPEPPGRDERVAFTRAMAQKGRQRIAALRGFIRKYSQSDLKERAYEHILRSHLELDSGEAATMEAARAFVIDSRNRLLALDRVAWLLADDGRFLEAAERFSEEVLAKAAPDTPSMARFLTTRGRIAMLRDKPSDAIDYLAKALALRPESSDAMLRLADALDQSGQDHRARQLYLQAFLASGDPGAKARLERYYRAKHGSLEGLDKLIEEAFDARPLPFEAGRYQGPEPRRVVLAELFSGTECFPCQAPDYAFNGVLEHFPPTALAAIQYHLHIPKPDPLANPDSYERAAYYGVHSVPAAFFAGSNRRMGGGRKRGAKKLFDDYKQIIAQAARSPSKVEVRASGSLQGGTLTFNASARKPAAPGQPPGQLRLRVALAEGLIRYIGYNGVYHHHNVVRKMLPDSRGAALEAGSASLEGQLDLAALESELEAHLRQAEEEKGLKLREYRHAIDRSQLRLVAFVQDDQSKEVLQAVMVPVEAQ